MNLVILRLFTAPEAEATFEIIVIILLALILGFVLGWFFFGRKSSHSEEYLADFEAFKKQVEKEQKEQNSLIQSLKDTCGGKVDLSGLEASIADLKNKQVGFSDLAKGVKNYDSEVSGLQSENKKLWDALNSGDKPKDYDSEVSGLQTEDQKLWDAINELKKSGMVSKTVAPVKSNDKESAKLQDVAAKKHLINFSSIGTATEADKDDLKLIKGVGPFIEKKLNALDIWTFAQVAAFKTEDVDNVTEAIEFFPGRIIRDNWVDQAKELAKK